MSVHATWCRVHFGSGWYCTCQAINESPKPSPRTEASNDSSPRTPDAPLEPGNVGTINRDLLVNALQEFELILRREMKTVESRIDLIEARLHHIKELLVHPLPFYDPKEVFDDSAMLIRKPGDTIHEPPPSSSHTHECHRGLTYREEQLLAKMYQQEVEQAEKQGSRPMPGVVVKVPGTLDPLHKSTL